MDGTQDFESYFDLIACRESCRAYAPRPVEPEKLRRCVEAGRLAPSACNSQPWHFTVVTEASLVSALAPCVQGAGMNGFAGQVPAFVVVTEEQASLRARLGERVKDQQYAQVDIGLATAHFCLAATAQGLSTCILGWFDEPKVKALLDLPKQKRVRLVLCVGYAQTDTLRPKKRKPLEEIAAFRHG